MFYNRRLPVAIDKRLYQKDCTQLAVCRRLPSLAYTFELQHLLNDFTGFDKKHRYIPYQVQGLMN